MNERSYLSIGDVLTLLREEFPDVTISKIRFLESRGLLIPERTPSGYRKFYDHDVDRLRWILRQQRENFLPLKVIKGRLEGQEPSSEPKPLFEVADAGDVPPLEPVFAAQSLNGSHGHEEPAAHAPAAHSSPSHAGTHATPKTTAQSHAPAASLAHPQTPSQSAGSALRSSQAAALAGVTSGGPGPRATGPGGLLAARATAGAGPATLRPAEGSAGLGEPGGRPPAAPPVPEVAPSNGAGAAAQPKPAAGPARTVRTAVTAAAAAAAPAATSRSGGPGPATSQSASGAPSPAAAGISAPGGREAAVGAAVPTEEPNASQPAPPATAAATTPAAGAGVASAAAVPPGPAAAVTTDAGSLAGASLTAGELAQASGLDVRQIEELESYGLIEGHLVAGVRCFDEDALVVAGLAAGFARFGVEARHLRMFKHAAERQASMYSQIVMPLLRQRNPDARRRAHDDLVRLSELGASMQACFAKAVLHDLTRG